MISDLWNFCKTGHQKHLLFLKFCLRKILKIFLENVSERSNIFIISERQSSLSNKFYDRNQTLQAEAIVTIVRIDWPTWLALYQFFIAGADPRGDGTIGTIAPPLKRNFIHHDFVQFGKQNSRYKAIFPSIVLSQQCCEICFISLTVVNPWWDFTTKYYWNRPLSLVGWILPCLTVIKLHLRLNVIAGSVCSIDCSRLLRRSRACFQLQIPFLIRKCAHLVLHAHISLQVKQ